MAGPVIRPTWVRCPCHPFAPWRLGEKKGPDRDIFIVSVRAKLMTDCPLLSLTFEPACLLEHLLRCDPKVRTDTTAIE